MYLLRSLCILLSLVSLALAACTSTDDSDGSSSSADSGYSGTDAGSSDAGHGNDMPGSDAAETACPDFDALTGTVVSGQIYIDEDESDESTYVSEFDGENDSPVMGTEIRLLGADNVNTTSCEDGTFAFSDLEDGVYLVVPDLADNQECQTRNCPRRLPAAIEEGTVNIVTFGDSVPVEGDDWTFPGRFATLMSPLAEINSENVAIGGTVSTDWLPGTTYFEDILAPLVPDSDVIMVSLGGNDVLAYASNPALLGDLEGAVDGAMELVGEIADNLLSIVNAIRDINSNVDIVYCLYPDYGNSSDDFWSMVGGFLGPGSVTEILEEARSTINSDMDIVLTDLFGATEGMDFGPYLADALHPNGQGHTFYAEEIFKTLGGVLVGDHLLDDGAPTPLGLEHHYGLRP